MAQTPQQRKANAKFAKAQDSARGKPESAIKKKDKAKPPISKGWVLLLVFVVCGGVVFEVLRLLPGILDYFSGLFGVK